MLGSTGARETETPLPAATEIILPTSTPTPPPPPTKTVPPTESAGISRVNIYLVAMGDNGATGEYIGCGDSLVPVEIEIEPTLGVLRAALEVLLAVKGVGYYGDSGLYNPLYLSDLKISSLAVVDNKAIIHFSGQMIYGGECDIPRIEETLRAIALQYHTVDTAQVFVNDVPLETLLDLRG